MENNSNYDDDDSFEDDLINEFGDKDEDDSLSELESKLRPFEERLGMQVPEEEYIFDRGYLDELNELGKERKIEDKSKIIKKIEKERKNTKLILKVGFVIILLCVILDGIIIGYRLLNKEVIDVKTLLLYNEKPVVYDNNSINKRINDHVPIVNLNNSSMNDINNEIVTIYNNYNSSNPDYFRYDFAISDDILSIVLIYRNKLDQEQNYNYKFKTYNISLKTLTKVDDKYILSKFKLDKSDVHIKMRTDFNKHYNEMINKNYINDTYSYNSVINDLELSNFVSETNYYLDNNKLYVYRSFNIYNNKKITSYFDESCYKFFIK